MFWRWFTSKHSQCWTCGSDVMRNLREFNILSALRIARLVRFRIRIPVSPTVSPTWAFLPVVKGFSRDKERSPLFLVLQTPCTRFRHWSLPRVMWVVLWEVKACHDFLCLRMDESCFFIYLNWNGLRANTDMNRGKFWHRHCNNILCTEEIFTDIASFVM